MSAFALTIAVLLLLSLVAGMIRVVRGPTAADRMLAAQLFGTTGVAILLLLTLAVQTTAMLNVALVFALLATVVGVTFVQRGNPGPGATKEDDRERE
jgi:multicomponent Na+:H+ antiporter subunit F